MWKKENKWRLTVFLNAISEVEVDFKALPVPGVYVIRSNQIPVFAELQPLQCKHSLDFVVINRDLAILSLSIPYKGERGILTYRLALTRIAPFAFVSETVPFARPIFVREIIDTFNEYVEIS